MDEAGFADAPGHWCPYGHGATGGESAAIVFG
jgi:hypothetical protein